MWQLAIKAMLGDRSKLLISLAGVAFSVVLVNLQGGLLLGLIRKGSLLVEHGQADIWVGHPYMKNVDMSSGTFVPERWVLRIRGIEGIERAEAYLIAASELRMPDGRSEAIMLVGCDPGSLLGNAWDMAEGDPHAVREPDAVFVDREDAARLGHVRVGDVREINGHRARVVGLSRGAVGFTNVPYVFTTRERIRAKYSSGVPAGYCSYFLVKARPGTDSKDLCARIQGQLPGAAVYDRETYGHMSMMYWLVQTGIGISFGLTVLLGLLVGLAVVANTLYASVVERAKEFGTLKALGADDGCVGRFIVVQALANAGLGSIVGLLAVQVLGRLASNPQAPIVLAGWVAAASVILVVLVCLLATWLPYWRICSIDPASVLRA